MTTKSTDTQELTTAKILYILETRKTIPSDYTSTQVNEMYATMIADHIHRNFVLKSQVLAAIDKPAQIILTAEMVHDGDDGSETARHYDQLRRQINPSPPTSQDKRSRETSDRKTYQSKNYSR